MCAKVAIVTGSNKGIGYGIVKALCEQFDGDVYLTARDIGRGEKAVESLNELGLYPKFHQLDITDKKSIMRFKKFIKKNYPGINVLVNNAAVAYKVCTQDAFGQQVRDTMRVNYFALRKVCDAFFPLLLPGARVVNVSSSAGHLSCIPGEKLKMKLSWPTLSIAGLDALMRQFVFTARAGMHQKFGWPSRIYSVSKLGVCVLSEKQQKQFDKDRRKDIVVNSVHPGFVRTDMTNNEGRLTIDEGAEAPVYLALLPEGEIKVKGQFIWSDKTINSWSS